MVNNLQFYTEGNETLDQVNAIVTLIFDIVIIITMFLCFFALSSSMRTNLMEQAKEIGILRAIGFTKIRIIILYVYEAFILVMASSMMGIIVGVGVAFSMTMQFTVL
jgi:ABC-type antimicrobial peptide transport system permease subunit